MTSQSKEDRNLLNIFPGICNGTYIEMGALDGVRYSNTHVFHKALGWKGVLVEVSPYNFAELKKNRPNELALVNAGVCKEESTVHFLDLANDRDLSAVSGVWEFAAPAFRDRFWKGKTLDDATPIRCVPLRTILADQGPTFFADFFSLDVEGAELQVLPPTPLSSRRDLVSPLLPRPAHSLARVCGTRGRPSLPTLKCESAAARRRSWSPWTCTRPPLASSSSRPAPAPPIKTP